MNNYEMLWNERKQFLKVNSMIGAILSVGLNIWFYKDSFGISAFWKCGGLGSLIFTTLLGFLLFTACISIARMMKEQGQTGLLIGFLTGFLSVIIRTAKTGVVGLSFGMVMMFVFGGLFLIVAAGYSVYLPVSSIYRFVKYKQEQVA